MKLKGKVAIVTGGGRGLGRAIAIAMANEGASLVIASRSTEELAATAKHIGRPGTVLKVKCDVTKEGDVNRMVKMALSKFGRIDILVNNAGTIGPIGPTSKVAARDWIRTLSVNLVGTFLCTQAALPALLKSKHGKIINIAGSGEAPLANFSAYASSKSAIVRFTATLAEEVKQQRIDVNAIAPGSISTKMTKEIFNAGEIAGKEHARAKDILAHKAVPLELPASLVVFLASSESDGLTGKIISAVHDDWKGFGAMKSELTESDLYTMKRIDTNIMERLKLPKNKKIGASGAK